MAAIKVQSLEDIIEAYCCSLGYKDRKLQQVVKLISEQYANRINSQDVVASLDSIIIDKTGSYLNGDDLSEKQKMLMFRLFFLLNDGAEKWGVSLWEKRELPVDCIDAMKSFNFAVVPEFCISCMKPQNIESPNPLGILHKIKRLFYKG